MQIKTFKETVNTEVVHKEYIAIDGIKFDTMDEATRHENKCFRARDGYLALQNLLPEFYSIKRLEGIFLSYENNRSQWEASSEKDYQDFSSSQWGLCQAIRILTKNSAFAEGVYPVGIEMESF